MTKKIKPTQVQLDEIRRLRGAETTTPLKTELTDEQKINQLTKVGIVPDAIVRRKTHPELGLGLVLSVERDIKHYSNEEDRREDVLAAIRWPLFDEQGEVRDYHVTKQRWDIAFKSLEVFDVP